VTRVVIRTLHELGVTIWVEGDKILFEPGSRVPQKFLPAIKKNKDELVGWLEKQFVHVEQVYDLPNLSSLPPGQRRAIQALIGGGQHARTYAEAAQLADMSEGTMLTHVNRVRRRHPRLYQKVRNVRLAQLAVRHEVALGNAQEHSREYFRNVNRSL